jgi:hypothetical protein
MRAPAPSLLWPTHQTTQQAFLSTNKLKKIQSAMQFFKTALAFSSMAALTLTDTGTAKSVDNVLGIGMITPDKGGNDVLMVFHPPASRVCRVYPQAYISGPRERHLLKTWQTDRAHHNIRFGRRGFV